MEEATPVTASPLQQQPLQTPRQRNSLVVLLLITTSLSLTLVGYFGYQNYTLRKKSPPKQLNTTGSTQVSPSPTAIETNEWETAAYGGMFTYDYPKGWHVAELWDLNLAHHGFMLAIDPKPISTAPRGGPLSTIEIRVYYGEPNPVAVLEEEKASSNDNSLDDFSSETISTNYGEVFHYKGVTTGEYLRGTTIEKYVFSFNKSDSNPLNQMTIVASTFGDGNSDLSAKLEHIVKSFKEAS